jgi:Protein kinase domain
MLCPWCETNNSNDAKKCQNCGSSLRKGEKLGNLQVGYKLKDRYEIRKILGYGGMGVVYGALDHVLLPKKVAVKEIDFAQSISAKRDGDTTSLFEREVDTLAKLDHPNIVRVTDKDAIEKRRYMIMDYIDGSTLENILEKRAALPESTVLPWAKSLCDALTYLHKKNIIMGDVNPKNIMVDQDGRLRLIDFGIATRINQEQTNELYGTTGYVAPELLQGGTPSIQSDIYSLCATLYVLLTNIDPERQEFTFPLPAGLKISQQSQDTIQKGLKPSPRERWASVEEVSANLPDSRIGKWIPDGGAGGGVERGRNQLQKLLATLLNPRALTTRLGQQFAVMSTAQFAALIALVAAVTALAIWGLAPTLKNYAYLDIIYPIFATIGVAAYYATYKRRAAFYSSSAIGLAAVSAYRISLGLLGSNFLILIVGTLVAGLFMEIWIAVWRRAVFQSGIASRSSRASQRRIEFLGLTIMAIVANFIFYGAVYSDAIYPPYLGIGIYAKFWPNLLIGGVVNAMLGWFIGETIRQVRYARAQV